MGSERPLILFAEASAADLEHYEQLKASATLVQSEQPISDGAVSFSEEELAKAEVLSVMVHSKVDRPLMDRMPNLRLIATRSTGFDHIDRLEAKDRGIAIAYVPEYGTDTVAEYTFALLLNLTRQSHKAYVRSLTGEFNFAGLMGTDLCGKTLGVIGLGRIGQKVARIAHGFDMNVVAFDPVVLRKSTDGLAAKLASLDEVLAGSDALAICCPLNESTHHLLSDREFGLMRQGVYLVNTARGAVLNTAALLSAIQTGTVAAAALDVLEEEGSVSEEAALSELVGHQLGSLHTLACNLALLRHPNVLVTPHMAYFSKEAVERIHRTTAANIHGFIGGVPTNIVQA
ncbi:MAG TPA: NAD(P)-dependent oxidoreductase [Fimbriimonas sp.]|nr:NAD(P)-dependent oxidoreductase [Fimbriimonas sp.]